MPKPVPKPESWWDSSAGRFTTAVVIPIIISIILFQFQLNLTAAYETKTIANNFLSEINVLEPNIITANTYYRNSITTKQPTVKPDFLYPDTGLFYTNSGDLGKLDANLTRNLRLFYFRLTTAESDRKKLIVYLNTISPNATSNDFEKEVANSALTPTYNEIIAYTNDATLQISELKDELQTVAERKPFIVW